MNFATPVPRYGGALGVPDYIGLFVSGSRDNYVSWQRNEGICPLFFDFVAPGKYELRYIEGNGYEPVRASIPIVITVDGRLAPSGATQQRTPSAGGCGLGLRWTEKEEGWSGVWTRRGTSNVFDVRATKGGIAPLTAVQTVTVSGDLVSIERTNANDGNDCRMEGKIATDGVHVSGTYRCRSGGPYQWSAEIQCQ